MASDDDAAPFRLSSLGLSVYLPTFLFAVGQGAVIPFTPLLAKDLGASVAFASFIVALRAIGMMVFDVPAGMLVSALGERRAMVVGTLILAVVAIGASFSQNPAQLAVLMLVMGFSWSIWQLARLSYVSDKAPIEIRGRALSLIGGTNRIGNFVGPFVGSLIVYEFGLASTFVVQAVMAIVASGLMFVLIREDWQERNEQGPAHHRLKRVVVENRRTFATAGVATVCLSVLRSSRQAIIPLWGDSIGLSPTAVGNIFGASNGMDMLLFYPTGSVMDRFGRKFVAIPCLVTLASGLLLIPVATTTPLFVFVAMLTGFGNGLGAGIVMTLGADFAPRFARTEFLSVWRLISDIGQSGGPIVLAALTGAAGLGAASAATGGIGLIGAVIMWRLVPEPLKKRAAAVEVAAAPVPAEP